MTKTTRACYTLEFKQEAVRLVLERQSEYGSQREVAFLRDARPWSADRPSRRNSVMR